MEGQTWRGGKAEGELGTVCEVGGQYRKKHRCVICHAVASNITIIQYLGTDPLNAQCE